jgi:hypothetical protein
MKNFDSNLHLSDGMPAECFEGGTGDLVIVQEYTTLASETYVRVCIPMSDAVMLANDILAVAAHAAGSAK